MDLLLFYPSWLCVLPLYNIEGLLVKQSGNSIKCKKVCVVIGVTEAENWDVSVLFSRLHCHIIGS